MTSFLEQGGEFLESVGRGIAGMLKDPPKQRPEDWKSNDSIAEITRMLNDDVPTYKQIGEAMSMAPRATMWSVKAGRNIPSFGQLLAARKAADIQSQRELANLFASQEANESAAQRYQDMYSLKLRGIEDKERRTALQERRIANTHDAQSRRLINQEHKMELDALRILAKQGHISAGVMYQRLIKIMEENDDRTANEVMGAVDEDDFDYINSDPVAVSQWLTDKLAGMGIGASGRKKPLSKDQKVGDTLMRFTTTNDGRIVMEPVD